MNIKERTLLELEGQNIDSVKPIENMLGFTFLKD